MIFDVCFNYCYNLFSYLWSGNFNIEWSLCLCFSALFEVVEQQDIDSVKAILESNTVDVNRYVCFIKLCQFQHFLITYIKSLFKSFKKNKA